MMVFVKCLRRPGMRRAGVYIPHYGSGFDLTEAQLAQISADPEFVIESGAPEPTFDADQIAELVEAFAVMDAKEPPKVSDLGELVKFKVSAALRDAAWAQRDA